MTRFLEKVGGAMLDSPWTGIALVAGVALCGAILAIV